MFLVNFVYKFNLNLLGHNAITPRLNFFLKLVILQQLRIEPPEEPAGFCFCEVWSELFDCFQGCSSKLIVLKSCKFSHFNIPSVGVSCFQGFC